MNTSVITEMATSEIIDQIAEMESTLHNMKLSHAVSPREKPTDLKFKRKEIARLKTELNKRNKNQ